MWAARSEDGSAVVESVFGMLFLMILVIGVVQVALTLYARNVVMAAAHDGARAAVEIGGSSHDATVVARRVIEDSTGSLVDDLEVSASSIASRDRRIVHVRVIGSVSPPGPIPVDVPLSIEATSSREVFAGDR